MIALAKKFAANVLPALLKPARVLWNEVIGFVFVAFAVISGFSLFRTVRDYKGDTDSIFRIVLTAGFCLLMAYYGVTSFLRARKISRS